MKLPVLMYVMTEDQAKLGGIYISWSKTKRINRYKLLRMDDAERHEDYVWACFDVDNGGLNHKGSYDGYAYLCKTRQEGRDKARIHMKNGYTKLTSPIKYMRVK